MSVVNFPNLWYGFCFLAKKKNHYGVVWIIRVLPASISFQQGNSETTFRHNIKISLAAEIHYIDCMVGFIALIISSTLVKTNHAPGGPKFHSKYKIK